MEKTINRSIKRQQCDGSGLNDAVPVVACKLNPLAQFQLGDWLYVSFERGAFSKIQDLF